MAIIVEHPVLRLEAAAYFKAIFARLKERSGSGKDTDLGSTLLLAFTVLIGFAPDAVSLILDIDLGDPGARKRLSADRSDLLYGPFASSP